MSIFAAPLASRGTGGGTEQKAAAIFGWQDKYIAMTEALIASTDVDGFRVDTPMQVRAQSSLCLEVRERRGDPKFCAHCLKKHASVIFG